MKSTIIAVIIGVVLVGGTLMFTKKTPARQLETTTAVNNVTETDGIQSISIIAKGGYSPKLVTAKADTKTILKVQTNGTFDCSASLNIPALSYQKNLPATGITEVELPPQKAGTTIEGLCGMGMYKFEIAFK